MLFSDFGEKKIYKVNSEHLRVGSYPGDTTLNVANIAYNTIIIN